MAGLLGLDIKCYDRTLTATSPETGRKGVMTFNFAPAFKSDDYAAAFNSDFENLQKFEYFLMGEMYAKFGDAVRDMHQFVEHRGFLLNYLRVNHSSHEYLYEKYKLLIQTAKSRTYYGCLTTSSYDFDVVLVAAAATIEWFRKRNELDRGSDIGYVEIEHAIKANLKNQIEQTEEDRKLMLYRMHETKESYEKDDASYWDYIKIMKNISENPGAFWDSPL